MKKGSGGWLILLAALAVPSVLFYNWWAKQSAAQRAELQKQVRNRLPPGTPMFGNQPPATQLNNPLDRPQASTASATAQASPIQASTSSASAAAPAAAPVTQAPAAPSVAPAVPPSSSTAVASAVPAADVSVDSMVVLARDPTLSPYDMVRLEQMKLEDELRKKELAGGGHHRVAHRVAEHPVENDIDLQGIVSTDEGDKAIINGEMVAEGELVKGAKIVKITSQAVVFNYRGRRFSKTITK